MEINIKAIRFDATEKLEAFIQKKVEKLQKTYEDIQSIDVQLKVVKPASAMNKETSLTVAVPGQKLFVEKTHFLNCRRKHCIYNCDSVFYEGKRKYLGNGRINH